MGTEAPSFCREAPACGCQAIHCWHSVPTKCGSACIYAGVTQVGVGDRVCAVIDCGGHAEEVVTDPATVYKPPPSMPFHHAPQFQTSDATAFAAMDWRARLQPNEILLVHDAAGAVGWPQNHHRVGIRLSGRSRCRGCGCVGGLRGRHPSPDKLTTKRYHSALVADFGDGITNRLPTGLGDKPVDKVPLSTAE